MTRIVYISGRYRHYDAQGRLNRAAMAEELADEQAWAATLALAGVGWFAPLSNSVPVEQRVHVKDEHYIAVDLSMIRRLRPGYDCILMRPGWDDEPVSKGSAAEIEIAMECGLHVLYGKHGAEAVLAALEQLDELEAVQ